MKNHIDDVELSAESELEFILERLGAFHEMQHFGPRQKMLDMLKQMEQTIDEHDYVNSLSEMLADEEIKYHDPATHERTGHVIQILVIGMGLAHCAEARRPNVSHDYRWYHTMWAMSYAGYLRGTIPGYQTGFRAATRLRATKGATVRHKENREMKNEVFNWLTKNMERFRSKDAAAEAIAGEVVPVAVRTARAWVDQWKKSQSPEEK